MRSDEIGYLWVSLGISVGLTSLHIETGEDKNPRKDNGTTPLHNAAHKRIQMEISTHLLENSILYAESFKIDSRHL